MNKAQLVAELSQRINSTKKDAEIYLNTLIEVISNELKNNGKVQLVGFGSFSVKKRAARKGRNPQTKEEIKIPATKAPVFKAGKGSKDKIK